MALTMMTVAGIAGTIVLFEGLAALMESMVGNPEQDVQMALRQLAAKNQRRAIGQLASEQAYSEDMNERLAPLNSMMSRALTSNAMNEGPGLYLKDSSPTMLSNIERKLGVPPGHLARISSPTRMGDTSPIFHAVGKSIPAPAGNPSSKPQPGQGGPPGQPPIRG